MTATHVGAPTFRFSARAERGANRLGITLADAVEAIATATSSDQDAGGRHRFDAEARGVPIRVVLGSADRFLIDAIQER